MSYQSARVMKHIFVKEIIQVRKKLNRQLSYPVLSVNVNIGQERCLEALSIGPERFEFKVAHLVLETAQCRWMNHGFSESLQMTAFISRTR
ncbi:hypothetical protein M0802_010354 [Mischocyttarus mexicanus]|nr:hypothetical protein M0802_010354 [Mischocyttarus mexicanus]